MPQIGEIKTNKQLYPRKVYKAEGTLYLKHQWTACIDCGKCRWVRLHKGVPISPRCLSCAASVRQLGKIRNLNGRFTTSDGYIWVKIAPQNPYFAMAHGKYYIQEHRLIMAQHLGRCLLSLEQVHHINGIKDDNRFENLLVILPNNHKRDYSSGYLEGYKTGYKTAMEDLKAKVDGIGEKRAELCFQHFSRTNIKIETQEARI